MNLQSRRRWFLRPMRIPFRHESTFWCMWKDLNLCRNAYETLVPPWYTYENWCVGLESNQDFRLMRPVSYRWTTPQYFGRRWRNRTLNGSSPLAWISSPVTSRWVPSSMFVDFEGIEPIRQTTLLLMADDFCRP